MKSAMIAILCVVGVLVLVELSTARIHGYGYGYYSDEYYNQRNNGQCDPVGCMQDCYEQGLHGECEPNSDTCQCLNCIYSACRRVCIRQNRIGQCDERTCLCL